ncbi:class I SAM-dependent methyltransferase [Nocardia sp. NPDC088792]|uniref:class I SAM-dependent methyltransferase n=1 Tax=Nocardia sp. NPDC088792 TaxID=3364332 RepID=UPI00380ABF2B
MASARPARCRACRAASPAPVLDLGEVAAADAFPPATAPVTAAETANPLVMVVCGSCGLAQLADDRTVPAEPRGIEPLALRAQAAAAVARVAAAGLLTGRTVREFGSPHGGSWLPALEERGLGVTAGAADVVVDSFGLMHEPDQRAAIARRVAATAPEGVLLVQFHSLLAIVARGQWNVLRHGHFGYYSLTVLRRLLREAGMTVLTAWEFDLYGGTVLLAAVPGPRSPDPLVARILHAERGLADPGVLRRLQRAADDDARGLHAWLASEAAAGHRIFAYGAASRSVALFHRAGVDRRLLRAVADASPAKQGRRMPGTDIPVISPEELVAARPDRVFLTLPELLPELIEQYGELSEEWVVSWPDAG